MRSDDTDLTNGCLQFLPGSHRIIARKPNAYHNRPVFEAHPELRAIEPRPVTLKAGSCTLHNHMTVHEGGANTAPRDSPNGGRRGFTMSFIPGEPPKRPHQAFSKSALTKDVMTEGHNRFNGRRVSTFTDEEHASLVPGSTMAVGPPFHYPLCS